MDMAQSCACPPKTHRDTIIPCRELRGVVCRGQLVYLHGRLQKSHLFSPISLRRMSTNAALSNSMVSGLTQVSFPLPSPSRETCRLLQLRPGRALRSLSPQENPVFAAARVFVFFSTRALRHGDFSLTTYLQPGAQVSSRRLQCTTERISADRGLSQLPKNGWLPKPRDFFCSRRSSGGSLFPAPHSILRARGQSTRCGRSRGTTMPLLFGALGHVAASLRLGGEDSYAPVPAILCRFRYVSSFRSSQWLPRKPVTAALRQRRSFPHAICGVGTARCRHPWTWRYAARILTFRLRAPPFFPRFAGELYHPPASCHHGQAQEHP